MSGYIGTRLVVPTEVVLEEWGLPWEDNPDKDIKILENTIIEHNRWDVTHRIIVQIGQLIYESFYTVGATEHQDEGPWEMTKEVIFDLVVPVEKTVTVYEKFTTEPLDAGK